MANKTYSIGLIGSGSWATAIAKILTQNINQLHWWIRSENTFKILSKSGRNPKYIQSIIFDTKKLNLSLDIKKVIADADIIIVAVPSTYIHSTFEGLDKKLFEGKFIVTASKGVLPETSQLPSAYYKSNFTITENNMGMIAGPCHAEEVALERLSYLTAASKNESLRNYLKTVLSCRFIFTTTSENFQAIEFCAIMKNIYAVCSGICHGVGFGDNFQSVLVSNAIRETERFLNKAVPHNENINSSACLGDLLVTTYSNFSRNRNFGLMVGKGYSVNAARLEMNMVAEGFNASRGINSLNKTYKIDLPIVECVYNILHENISPIVEVKIMTEKLN